MDRQSATKILRDTLDANNLRDWHVRLTNDVTKPFLGLCSYKDKCIILNAHHIDSHPEPEVIDTIRHEVAHALTNGHGHDDIWAAKARALGCTNTLPCSHLSFDPRIIDAIRSGADVQVEFETETQIIHKPKYTITRLQDKCPTCGKVAKATLVREIKLGSKLRKITSLECGHTQITDADSSSDFESLVFDGSNECNHEWLKTTCIKCNAHKLYPFQVEGARFLERQNGRAAIFDEMGLGKTIQALAYLKFNPDKRPFLWVTKSGTKFQHGKEIIRVLGYKDVPFVIESSKDKPVGDMNCIASYDIFRRMKDLEIFKHFKCIILDECQAIKNPDSSRTQSVRKVCKEIPSIIPTSGTPWKNRGSEFFVVLNLLDPKLFNSYEGFKGRYVDFYWDGNKYKEGGIREPIEFRKTIAHIAIRRERSEVLPELPLINRTKLNCQVPDWARKVYQEEENKLVDTLTQSLINGDDNSFETQSKIMQNLIVMRQVVGIGKVPTTVEYIQEFLEETDRKLVCFVHHKKCGEMIYEQLSKWCEEQKLPKVLRLTADMDASLRSETADKFNGPNHRLLIASTLASGEGLNLQSCSDCIMHERQWNPANEEQAEGRFIRIGQLATSVNAIYVHGDDTIDPILDGIVDRKRIEFHNTMNHGQLAQWNESDIVKELTNAILNKRRNKNV